MMNRFIFIFAILIGAVGCISLLDFCAYVKSGKWETAVWVINSLVFFMLWAESVVHDEKERADSTTIP